MSLEANSHIQDGCSSQTVDMFASNCQRGPGELFVVKKEKAITGPNFRLFQCINSPNLISISIQEAWMTGIA
jgi:hypothetical protein